MTPEKKKTAVKVLIAAILFVALVATIAIANKIRADNDPCWPGCEGEISSQKR